MLERLLGGGGGARNTAVSSLFFTYDHVFVESEQRREEEDERSRSEAACLGHSSPRERLLDALAALQCGDVAVVDQALDIFRQIYCRRPDNFVRSPPCERTALAFALSNALTLDGVPRPPEDVALAMGLASCRPLLDIAHTLEFTDHERQVKFANLSECLELLEPDPADYTDIVCAKLEIPFNVASEGREKVPLVIERMYGRHPLVVLAVTIKWVLQGRKAAGDQLGKAEEGRLCEVTCCQPRTLHAAFLSAGL